MVHFRVCSSEHTYNSGRHFCAELSPNMQSNWSFRFTHKFLSILGTLLLISVQFLVLADDYENPAYQPDSVHTNYGQPANSRFSSSSSFNHSELPIIVWWNKNLFPHFSGDNMATIHCSVGSCVTTTVKKRKNDPRTRGFIFYGTDFRPYETPLPRQPHHEWALLHEESPMNNYILSHQPMLELFNHTATFRRESDYPLTLQHLPSLAYLTDRAPVPLREKNLLRETAGLAPVAYIQSHCGVPSDRDSYVQELMKHVKVDSLGKCIHNKDLPDELVNTLTMEEDGFLGIISKYKFHIAFENGLCRDYMTEKLFRPLHLGVVPIYWGSEAAKDWTPNDHSIILKDDFASPKELADYINFLDQNDDEYQKFLEYRQPNGITNRLLVEEMERRPWGPGSMEEPNFINGFECHVCDRIVERLQAERLHEDNPWGNTLLPPRMGQYSHMGCPQPTRAVDNEDTSAPGKEWLEYDWVNDFWGSMDMAHALKLMIQTGEKDAGKLFKYVDKLHDMH
ncbi:alpha-(1,3)-fucosyltransferase 11-like isoform X2 [Branchiostoma lanceolatum]|uniref:alpha-(1,3)-fucosyltransferase 11-like isoform X2 n=1 Tax=Branchiostoma lanceolatum TaxID=7740 RepID=UPI00345354EB